MSAITEAVDLAFKEARKLEKDGNTLGAREIYARVLVQDPGNKKAKKALRALEKKVGSAAPLQDWEVKALVELYQRNELTRALPMAQRLARQHPDEPMLHNMLGAILMQQGQRKQAIGAFEAALAVEAEFTDALQNLARAHLQGGDWPAAQATLERLVTFDPQDGETRFQLGIALHEQGQLEAALEQYLQSTQARPLFGPAHNNLGSVLWALGRTDEALTSFENALEIDPEDPNANAFMANLLLELGREEEAASFIAKMGQG